MKIETDPEQEQAIAKTLRQCARNIVASHAKVAEQEKISDTASKKAIDAALKCGKNLICAKETGKQFKGFKFLKWVRENCKFDERTAQRYMALVKNPTHVSESEIREAKSLRQAMIATGAIKPKAKESQDPVVLAWNWFQKFIPKLVKIQTLEEKERLLKAFFSFRTQCDEWEAEIEAAKKRAEEDKAFDAAEPVQ